MFLNPALMQEALQLREWAEKTMKIVDQNFSKKGNKKFEGSPFNFFQNCLSELRLSKEMEYLLQGYALTALRKAQRQDERGIIYTCTEISWLSRFSKFAAGCLNSTAQRKITEFWQKEFTASSVELLRQEAEKITLLEGDEKKRLLWMLSEKNVHVLTPDPKYEPKTFGCLFYEYKAILCSLSEVKALVCIKSIVKEGTPFRLLLQPKEKKEPFQLVPDDAYCTFAKTTPVVVFEGVTPLQREEFGKWLALKDFCQIILACAAIEPPFEPSSTLADIKDEEALKEILIYRTLYEKDVASVLLLDHVYATILQAEIKEIK